MTKTSQKSEAFKNFNTTNEFETSGTNSNASGCGGGKGGESCEYDNNVLSADTSVTVYTKCVCFAR